MHRYRVFARSGTHAAFRDTYMARLRTFLNVSDAKYLKSQGKRRGRPLVSRKRTDVLEQSSSREPTQSSQPSTSRRPSPTSASVAAVTSVSLTPAVIRPSGYGSRAASVPLDLSLPRFATPVARTEPCLMRWVHEYDTPASPVALSSPSVCLNLDTLSSDGEAGPGDVSYYPISISDESTQSGTEIRNALMTKHHRVFTLIWLRPHRHLHQLGCSSSSRFARLQQQPLSCRRQLLRRTLQRQLLGEPVAFDISSSIPESEAPGMSFLLVPLPSGMMLMPVSCSAQKVLAPGFPSQSGRWSLAIPQTHIITREGPFDAYFSPMDTGDYPLVSTGLPGCPYRFTSYTAPPVADTDTAFSIQLHNPRFLAGVPFPGVLGSSPGSGGCYRGHYQSTTRCRVDAIESAGFKAVCDFVGQNVVGGVSVVRSVGTVSYSSCYVGGPLYGFYGIMATYGGPGWTRALVDILLQYVHEL